MMRSARCIWGFENRLTACVKLPPLPKARVFSMPSNKFLRAMPTFQIAGSVAVLVTFKVLRLLSCRTSAASLGAPRGVELVRLGAAPDRTHLLDQQAA
jgi:hypothetical protein